MTTNHRERLIFFTRYPEPGRTKTRLIPHLGAEGAAELQRRMTEHILSRIRHLTATRPVSIEIRYDGGNQELMKDWLGTDYIYSPQHTGDLGRRMGRAFEEAFANGVTAAVIIGSDVPGISLKILYQAFNSLQKEDLTLGPANDGGYYLIGLKQLASKRALPKLLTRISWGGASVLEQSVKIAEKMGLKYTLLEKLADVDRPEDLTVWDQIGGKCFSAATNQRRISVIIPTLNEADNIVSTLKHIQSGENLEIIVVDGGSTDDTVRRVTDMGAIVIHTPTGRARQMNAGAAAASADLILFVHADTRLPQNFDMHIRQAMDGVGVVAGAFELRVDSPILTFRIIERLANWRSRRMQMPYGDQAIFVSASLFRDVGGFRPISIMEDFDLMRRLVKRGRIITLPVAVCTSPRRWLQAGIYRIWFIHQLVIVAYYLGIPPAKIGRLYNRLSGLNDK